MTAKLLVLLFISNFFFLNCDLTHIEVDNNNTLANITEAHTNDTITLEYTNENSTIDNSSLLAENANTNQTDSNSTSSSENQNETISNSQAINNLTLHENTTSSNASNLDHPSENEKEGQNNHTTEEVSNAEIRNTSEETKPKQEEESNKNQPKSEEPKKNTNLTPATSEPVQGSPPPKITIENLDHWENFNLTNEIERLYNQSQYEATEEEKLIQEAVPVIEHTDSPTISPEEMEEQRLRREWEEQVSNFVASDILTIKLKKKDYYNFYADISEVPSLVKIAFIVNNENLPIDFFVYNPKKKVIHKTKSKGQLYHEFELDAPGRYKFVLDNGKWAESKRVSFAIHMGNSTDAKLQSDNFDKISQKIFDVAKKVRDIKLKQKFLLKKFEGHSETVKVHNSQIIKYSIIECFTMVVILVVQLFYLKHLLNKIV